MKLTIDRIEGDLAILDADGLTFELPAVLLPDGAVEGCTLHLDLRIEAPDLSEDYARLDRLRQGSPEGDFDL